MASVDGSWSVCSSRDDLDERAYAQARLDGGSGSWSDDDFDFDDDTVCEVAVAPCALRIASPVAVAAAAGTPVRDRLVCCDNLREDENHDFDDFEPTRRHRARHSSTLVRRCGGSISSNDEIEVLRRGFVEGGLRPCTPLDRLVPELLRRPTATLGRRQRWVHLAELLERLEREGLCWRTKPAERAFERGRDGRGPLDIVRYAVKADEWLRADVAADAHLDAARARRRSRHGGGSRVYRVGKGGKCLLWYELACKLPLFQATRVAAAAAAAGTRKQQPVPLRGVLKAPPKLAPLTKKQRRAFAPGVAARCGAATTACDARLARSAVVRGAVELDFGRRVLVTHASIAGQIHETHSRAVVHDRDGLVVPRSAGASPGWVAIEGTEAYVTRFELSARLAANCGEWTCIGEFTGCCDNGRDECAVALDACAAAMTRKDGVSGLECTALRFRAVHFHGASPMLRVGAYGLEALSDATNKKKAQTLADATDHDGGGDETVVVEYLLRLLPKPRHDRDGTDDGSVRLRRTWAVKGRREHGFSPYYSTKETKAVKRKTFRRQLRADSDDRDLTT